MEECKMSREIENTIASFRRARIEGEQLLQQGRISWEDFAFVMVGFEEQIRNMGGDF
jgi:hypothetical protein